MMLQQMQFIDNLAGRLLFRATLYCISGDRASERTLRHLLLARLRLNDGWSWRDAVTADYRTGAGWHFVTVDLSARYTPETSELICPHIYQRRLSLRRCSAIRAPVPARHWNTGASESTPGDAKCVTEILGDKNKEVRGQFIW